jgi:putative transcriptional regulator
VQPCLLIASPQMNDPFFEQTVVLVWHHDEDGAVGVVINRPMDHALSDVLDGADFEDWPGASVCWGGPVDRHSASVVLRGHITDDEGWTIQENVAVTRSEDRLRRAIVERTDLLLCLGYAGWGAGQLERELESGGWLYTDPTEALVFDTPSHELYERALLTLGLTTATVLMTPGEA